LTLYRHSVYKLPYPTDASGTDVHGELSIVVVHPALEEALVTGGAASPG